MARIFIRLFVFLMMLSVVGHAQVTPTAYAAYIGSGSPVTWGPWTSAAAFGALQYTPPAIGLYCQSTPTSPWTPCNPSGGGGSGFPIVLGSTSIAASSTTTSVTGLSLNVNTGSSVAPTGSGLVTGNNLIHNTLKSDAGNCTLNVWDASQAVAQAPYYPTDLGTLLDCPTVNNNSLGSTSLADMYNGAALFNFSTVIPSTGSFNVLGFGDNDLSNMGGIGTNLQIAYYQEQLENWLWWLSTPDVNKIWANNASVTTTGTWTAGTNPSTSLQTTAAGTISASGSCTLCGVSILKTSGSTASYTISIDGVAQANPYTTSTTYVSGEGVYNSATGATADWSMYSFVMPPGWHTVEVTWVSGTVNVAGFEFFSPTSSSTSQIPVVKILAERWGHLATSPPYSPNHTDTIVAVLQGYEQAVVNKMASNGANVKAVDVNASGQGNGFEPNILAQTIGDYVHPSGNGGAPLLAAVIASQLNSAIAESDRSSKDIATAVPPNYTYTGSTTVTGNGNVVIWRMYVGNNGLISMNCSVSYTDTAGTGRAATATFSFNGYIANITSDILTPSGHFEITGGSHSLGTPLLFATTGAPFTMDLVIPITNYVSGNEPFYAKCTTDSAPGYVLSMMPGGSPIGPSATLTISPTW